MTTIAQPVARRTGCTSWKSSGHPSPLIRFSPHLERNRGPMNRDPILFRVDGTPQRGWENLARCLTLAAALQRRRRPTYFLAQLEPASLAFAVKRVGNDWLPANGPAGTAEDL